MQRSELQILDQWLEDPSFIRWCTKPDSPDHIKWEIWFNQHPDRRELAEVACLIINGINIKEKPVSEEISLASLKQVTSKLKLGQNTGPENKKVFHFLNSFFLKVAAGFLFLLAVASFFYLREKHLTVMVSTNYGEKMELVLPDQTQVILNANSSLEYNRKNVRDVLVEGEVFFNVKKKPQTGDKFFVRTRNLKVEVLGTSFNVNTRFDETEVYLKEGKIKLDLGLGGDQEPILMVPGDLFTYKASRTPILKKRKMDTQEKTNWTDGNIEFESIPLTEALVRLAEIYGFEIEDIPAMLDNKSISVGVPINDEKLTLEILTKVLGVQLQRQDGKWIFAEKFE